MKILNNLFAAFVLSFVMLFSAVVVLPASSTYAQAQSTSCGDSVLGLPTWYKYLELTDAPECAVEGPSLNGDLDWVKVGGLVAVALLEAMLRIASMVAVGFVIYGGFRFIVSQGEPENAKAARETVLNAIIGLVITIVAASVVSFITTRLTS